jgi:hypothetical protein
MNNIGVKKMKTNNTTAASAFGSDYQALLVFVSLGVALFTLGPIYAFYVLFF